MARSPDWEKIPMAGGADKPVWPLPGVVPKFATWSLGGGRPFGCKESTCQRWHAGIDLTGAPEGSLVIAPEDGLLVGLDKNWTEGTRAIFLRTDTGLFLVLGGLIAGSHQEFSRTHGERVKKGDKLGRIKGSYGMLHLEAYVADKTRMANSRWWKDDPPPTGLLNPIHYIERMVGDNASLLQTRQRLQALADLGHYTGSVGDAWGPAAVEALKKAQTALGIPADGKWGPVTEDAIQTALKAQTPCGSLEDCGGAEAHDQAPTGPPPTSPAPAPSPSTPPSDALRPLRVVGAVVAGVAVASLTAAAFYSFRRR